MSPGLENRKRKLGHSAAGKEDIVSKRMHLDVNIVNKDSQFPNGLQDEANQDLSDEMHNACPTNVYRIRFHYPLIDFMYGLDLFVLCSLRKFLYEHKYPLLSLVFGDSEVDNFNDIVLLCKEKSIHVKIENVDKYYVDNIISYASLFTKEKGKRFFINNYFNSFVKHLIFKFNSSLNNIEYLIIYTNSNLGLTKENKLIQGRSRNFYPFKFDSINMEECDILKDFLFTNGDIKECGFYQFSKDKKTKEELLKRLEFSPAARKVIEDRKFSEEKVKDFFLDKLIFAINQPNREDLNRIIKNEIEKKSKIMKFNYITLQKKILNDLIAKKKHKRIFGNIYEYKLLMFSLHDMFLRKKIFSINFESKCHVSNGITIHFKDKIIYVSALTTDSSIGYSQLFPPEQQERRSIFSINRQFNHFIELEKDINYFIIYTNADLDLTDEKSLKRTHSKDFYPLKFDSLDIQKKGFNVLGDYSIINKNGLYQFSQEETTRKKFLSLIKIPPSLIKEKRPCDKNEEKMKEIFLCKLIFAVNQPKIEDLNSAIRNEIDKSSIPYSYEELHEIALRWSESHEFHLITKEIMKRLLEDIKNNRSSYQKVQTKNIDKEIKFAKSVVGTGRKPTFEQFLDFLIKGEGKKYIENLKRQEIHLVNMSSILNRSGTNAVKAFKGLYNLWFNAKGDKTHYLKTLEKEGLNLANMSSVLNGAGVNSAKAFKELYDLWFDAGGNKTPYLKSLKEEKVNLVSMSSILNGSGTNASSAFKELYDLWFDSRGNKTQYLKTLEIEGVNLSSMSSLLNGAGTNAAKAFKELYDLLFDEGGNKTHYLKTLEKEGVNLASMTSVLNGAGVKASAAFKDLYDLWFDAEGNKTYYLKTLEGKDLNLANMSSILARAAANAAKAFKGLYDMWFDTEGIETQYLKTLEKEGITIISMSSILHGSGAKAANAFKELYNIFFDGKGNKKQYLKHFIEEKGDRKHFTIHNLSSILHGTGLKAKDAFEKLHSVCFNEEGKATKLLDNFYEAGFKPSHLSCMLCGSGVHASSVLKRFHCSCFNKEGIKTKLLDDFYKINFMPGDLCNILSGTEGSLENFHNFCFIEETKMFLNNFLNDKEGFTLSGLCSILHGARANVCSALKDFHCVCFDKTGNKTQLLEDFYKAGFMPHYLTRILSMTGINSASVLKIFHKSCFNKNNRLNHFLAEKKLFTPKELSIILHGAGTNTCLIFEKLYNLCFDKTGNKSKYLNNLIKIGRPKMFDVLYETVRKAPCDMRRFAISHINVL